MLDPEKLEVSMEAWTLDAVLGAVGTARPALVAPDTSLHAQRAAGAPSGTDHGHRCESAGSKNASRRCDAEGIRF